MNEDFALLLFWFGVSVTVNIAFTISWFQSRKRQRELDRQPSDDTRLDDLAARIESAVDSVNARLEEFAGGQDFMNRVLTDRLDRLGKALPEPEPHDTPA